MARVHGILRYRDFETLIGFRDLVDALRAELPDGWTLRVTGPVQDLLGHAARLRNGWLRTFGSGVPVFMSFLTSVVAFLSLFIATWELPAR